MRTVFFTPALPEMCIKHDMIPASGGHENSYLCIGTAGDREHENNFLYAGNASGGHGNSYLCIGTAGDGKHENNFLYAANASGGHGNGFLYTGTVCDMQETIYDLWYTEGHEY
jgi:hypothetical protein